VNIVEMPSLEEHCKRSTERYGINGREIHQWIDEPVTTIPGMNHREYRHNKKDFAYLPENLRLKYGGIALQIFLDHITYDNEESHPRHKRWTKEELELLESLAKTSLNYNDLADRAKDRLDRSPEAIYSKATKLRLEVGKGRICLNCNHIFKTKFKHTLFCSEKCKREYNRKHYTNTCITCEEKFVGYRRSKYCSEECRREASARKRSLGRYEQKRKKKIRICKYCNKEYTEGGTKFCSKECREAWYREHQQRTVVCRICGREFETSSQSTTLCLECKKERTIKQQLDGGPSREFARFILILREVDRDTYLNIREKYVGIIKGEAGNLKFDKWLNHFKNKLEE